MNPSTLPPDEGRRSPKCSLIASFGHAFDGLGYVIREERNARLHLLSACLVIALGLWLGLTPVEWGLLVIAIALVFAGEMLNTVVELVVDLITRDRHPLAKHAKDVAAGAILVASIAAVLLGLIILGPKLLVRLGIL
jgi:diacylglycerol kinase